MRQLLTFKLNNDTKMVVADTSSKQDAKEQAISYSNRLFEQRKYRIQPTNELVEYEKWHKSKNESYKDGTKEFSIAAIVNNQPIMVNVTAPGVKSAYINFKKLYVIERDVFCFIYELGQPEKRQSALALSNKTLKSKEDTTKFLRKAEQYLGSVPGLGVYAEDVPLLFGLIRDYVNGDYKEVPFTTILYSLAALIYLCVPVDIIPDFLPFVGKIDDMGVLMFVLKAVHNDLQIYKKNRQKSN